MATRSAGDEEAVQDAWYQLAACQGEALEAYGRALREYGQGSRPAEALAREVVGVTARGAVDAVRISLLLAADFYRWAWSLAGVTYPADELASYLPDRVRAHPPDGLDSNVLDRDEGPAPRRGTRRKAEPR